MKVMKVGDKKRDRASGFGNRRITLMQRVVVRKGIEVTRVGPSRSAGYRAEGKSLPNVLSTPNACAIC